MHIKSLITGTPNFAIFIDGGGLEEAAHALGGMIDFRKLPRAFAGLGRLLRANYYPSGQPGGYFSGPPLLDWLTYNGYSVPQVTAPKAAKRHESQEPRPALAVEMAIDAIDLAPYVSTTVLFTGDSQFVPLVRALKRRGSRVVAVSTIRATPPLIANELRRAVDDFTDLADLLPRIAT